MAKKIGTLIKEARTAAKLTQAKLAEKVTGVTAADIGKAERGEKELTQAQLKQIAKATGVTQASLLNAAGSSAKTSGKKTSSKKTASGKTASASKSSMQLTAAEKKLVELYRKADAEKKKEVMKLLKGTSDEAGEILTSLFTNVFSSLGKRSMPGEEGAEEPQDQEEQDQ